MSEFAEQPEDSETRSLFAKPGMSKGEQLAPVALPPGMGTAFPIATSPDRYCGTLLLEPGNGFNFHYHSRQDEVVYVIEGTMEAWVGQNCSVLGPGDMMFAPAGTAHANFNLSQKRVKLLNILSPLIPDVSEEWRMTETHAWEMVDVSGEHPWASLRKT
jgi:mannose-6-phosphate isomerase-like protein (cupin superfamily)